MLRACPQHYCITTGRVTLLLQNSALLNPVKTRQDSLRPVQHEPTITKTLNASITLIMAGAPGNDKLSEIAMQAERDLNSYRSKTGSGRDRATDYEAAGVSDVDTSKFPGASVKYGDDYVSSKSYNRRIPPDEGGDIDDHGR